MRSRPVTGADGAVSDGVVSDVAVALGCWIVASALLVGVAQAGNANPDGVVAPGFGQPTWWWTLTVLTLQAGALVARRRRPLAVLVAVAAAVPVLAWLGAGDATSFGVLVVVVAAYSAAVRRGVVGAAPALVAAVALVGLGSAASSLDIGTPAGLAWSTGLLQAVVTVGLPAAVAVFVRARRDARAAEADRLAALERERDALVQVALTRERMAMARELHDIAAHHLTGIAVMTGAMERQIDVAPADAKVAVRHVREQSTAMLREMRGLVGLLRDPGAVPGAAVSGAMSGVVSGTAMETPREARVESLAGIPALVDVATAAGRDVRLSVLGLSGERVPGERALGRLGGAVGPLAQLAAYRTVQECLANAARHAPGARCEVVVDLRDSAQVALTVRNDAPREPVAAQGRAGFGLVGMRERAELTDARLEYGPTADGGWLVSLTIPTEPDAASAEAGAVTTEPAQ